MAIHSDGTMPPARLQSQPSSCHQLRESAEPPSSSQNKCSVSFECNICLEVADDPVVTLCGHLFCWPCLYKWLQRSSGKDCPVCKATVEEKVIPLYGRGGAEPLDSSRTIVHSDIPRRPLGQRPETLSSARHHGRFRGITLSLGFGFLPSLLTLQFNNFLNSSSSVDDGDNGNNFGARGRFSYLCTPSQSVPATADQQEEAALVSRLVFLAVFAVLCLFFL